MGDNLKELNNALILAEQQLFGWYSASSGDSISQLARGMGLSLEEWEVLKETDQVTYLSEQQISEIDVYFTNRELI